MKGIKKISNKSSWFCCSSFKRASYHPPAWLPPLFFSIASFEEPRRQHCCCWWVEVLMVMPLCIQELRRSGGHPSTLVLAHQYLPVSKRWPPGHLRAFSSLGSIAHITGRTGFTQSIPCPVWSVDVFLNHSLLGSWKPWGTTSWRKDLDWLTSSTTFCPAKTHVASVGAALLGGRALDVTSLLTVTGPNAVEAYGWSTPCSPGGGLGRLP